MYFKPRIFISSTMGDKLQLRTEIKNEFEKHGAEVALYEKDLTPSVDLNTYRNDVLKADFVIFIIDDRYGKKTEFGISGTEEEFVLVQSNKIPFHVYLKKIRKTKSAKAFEEKLKAKGISYYYYDNEDELKEKLFSTTFTIARDIIYSEIDQLSLDQTLVRKLAVRYDYETCLSICKGFEKVLEITNNTDFSLENSDILITTFSPYANHVLKNKPSLIDKQLDNLLRAFLLAISVLTQKICNESTPGRTSQEVEFLGEQKISISLNSWNPYVDFNWYSVQVQNIITAYNAFRNYLSSMKMEGDLL